MNSEPRYPGVIYGYHVRQPGTGVTRWGYIGRTRTPVRRDQQHRGRVANRDGSRREQPWMDLVVGGMQILQQGEFTDAELDAAELAEIRFRRPLYNYIGNEDNPHRVPMFAASRQRWERNCARRCRPLVDRVLDAAWSRWESSSARRRRPLADRVLDAAWSRFIGWVRRLK